MTFAKHAIASLICAGGLSGCGTISSIDKGIDKETTVIEDMQQQLRSSSASTAVLMRKRMKIAGEEVALRAETMLPAIFDTPILYSTGGQRLDEVLDALSRQAGIPVWLTEFASESGGNSYQTRSDAGQGRIQIQLQWNGTLRGLFDHLAQTAKLHWRFNEGRVEFFLYETRHFYVNLPMGSRTMTSRISGSGRSSSGTAANNNNANAGTGDISINTGDMTINPYSALTRTITAMLMEDDGRAEIVGSNDMGMSGSQSAANRVSVNEARGTGVTQQPTSSRSGRSRVVVTPEMAMITVTAPPTSLDRIADYITRVNQRFSKNVMIDVKIYDVSLNEQASAGFSADLLYTKLGSYGVQVAGGSIGILGPTQGDVDALTARRAAAAGSSQTTTSITTDPLTGMPTTSTTTTSTPGVIAPSVSRFAGSTAMARALQTFGKISAITSGQVMAVNGQPAPLQIATEVTYLASTSTTVASSNTLLSNNSGAVTPVATSLTPGSVVVGLTANFLPQVLGDNRILLQYQLTSSSLAGMSTVSSGNSSIQTPTVSSQSLQQQAFVRDGEAIVLFGLEQTASSLTGGQSIPANVGRDASKSRTLRVIMLQIFGGGDSANI
ncbi:type II secretion system protein GspD [Comamonas composti]|uniref:type II secretion system protein GspD n=1 Tax=Comamonas composti TaxID=408558 RepID=UPI00047DA970|nr:hypothetical protein [Comamonas composti]